MFIKFDKKSILFKYQKIYKECTLPIHKGANITKTGIKIDIIDGKLLMVK